MKTELVDTKDTQRYLVRARLEVVHILENVMASRAIIALYDDASKRSFMLSSLLEVDASQGDLFLEMGADQPFNKRLLAAGEMTCVTSLNQIHVQFTARHLRSVVREGKNAFLAQLPSELLRLQRRESYRLETSVIHPVQCAINTGHGFVETVVVDISLGGLGLLAYEDVGNLLQRGVVYHGCRLSLPGRGEFAVSLNVCTTFDVALKNGKQTHRAGCQFIDLPASIETEIQRYIIRVDRERVSRYL